METSSVTTNTCNRSQVASLRYQWIRQAKSAKPTTNRREIPHFPCIWWAHRFEPRSCTSGQKLCKGHRLRDVECPGYTASRGPPCRRNHPYDCLCMSKRTIQDTLATDPFGIQREPKREPNILGDLYVKINASIMHTVADLSGS